MSFDVGDIIFIINIKRQWKNYVVVVEKSEEYTYFNSSKATPCRMSNTALFQYCSAQDIWDHTRQLTKIIHIKVND